MCSHIWLEMNSVQVCTKCGLTKLENGKILFDKNIVNYKSKRGKNK